MSTLSAAPASDTLAPIAHVALPAGSLTGRLRSSAGRRSRQGTADSSRADRGAAYGRAHARSVDGADRPRHRRRRRLWWRDEDEASASRWHRAKAARAAQQVQRCPSCRNRDVRPTASGPVSSGDSGGSAEDPVHTYLKEIGRVPLLNAELEVEIAKTIEEGNAAAARLAAHELAVAGEGRPEDAARCGRAVPEQAADAQRASRPRTSSLRPTCASSSRSPSAIATGAWRSST